MRRVLEQLALMAATWVDGSNVGVLGLLRGMKYQAGTVRDGAGGLVQTREERLLLLQ